MDLLDRIRQKKRQEQDNPAPQQYNVRLQESSLSNKVMSSQPESHHEDLQHETTVHFTGIFQAPPPVHNIISKDPLEAILADREAAGCSENQLFISETHAVSTHINDKEFLCFKVSNRSYGIDIMDIKEIIKPREVVEVPGAPSFLSGIISLRSVIVPIIDLPVRLGLVRCTTVTEHERIIIVRRDELFYGLLVDEIIQIVRIALDDIEAVPIDLDVINPDFFTGFGRINGQSIILLNLNTIINGQSY